MIAPRCRIVLSALLSRRWPEITRRHLFSSLTARVAHSDRPKVLTDFLEPYPYLAKHVLKLTITPGRSPNTYDRCYTTWPGVLQLLAHLPRLRTLRLEYVSILPPIGQPLFPSANHTRPRLEHLIVHYVLSGMIPLFTLVSLCRAEHVDIVWTPRLLVYTDDDDDADKLIPQGPIEDYIPPFEIRSLCLNLQLDGENSAPISHLIHDTLQRLLPKTTLRSFRYDDRLGEYDEDGVLPLTPLLRAASTMVTDLGLCMSESRLSSPREPPLTTPDQIASY